MKNTVAFNANNLSLNENYFYNTQKIKEGLKQKINKYLQNKTKKIWPFPPIFCTDNLLFNIGNPITS